MYFVAFHAQASNLQNNLLHDATNIIRIKILKGERIRQLVKFQLVEAWECQSVFGSEHGAFEEIRLPPRIRVRPLLNPNHLPSYWQAASPASFVSNYEDRSIARTRGTLRLVSPHILAGPARSAKHEMSKLNG